MNRRFALHALVVVGILMLAVPAFAAKGGQGNGNNAVVGAASCAVSGDVVSATGLPTDEVVNFMVTDASGTTGWVLGYTPDGTWSTHVPAPNGPTTYEFVSRTSGKGGTNYTVFASCSV